MVWHVSLWGKENTFPLDLSLKKKKILGQIGDWCFGKLAGSEKN